MKKLHIQKIKLVIIITLFQFETLLKADTCVSSFEKDSANSKAIFIGKVVDVTNDKLMVDQDFKTIFTFEILGSYRGLHIRGNYVSIIGPIDGCCNHHFVKDSVYLIFAYENVGIQGMLYNNDCSSSGLLSEKGDDIKRLGKPLKHYKNRLQMNIIYTEQIHEDSVKNTVNNLNKKLETLKKENRNLLYILIGILIIVLIIIYKLKFKK